MLAYAAAYALDFLSGWMRRDLLADRKQVKGEQKEKQWAGEVWQPLVVCRPGHSSTEQKP